MNKENEEKIETIIDSLDKVKIQVMNYGINYELQTITFTVYDEIFKNVHEIHYNLRIFEKFSDIIPNAIYQQVRKRRLKMEFLSGLFIGTVGGLFIGALLIINLEDEEE